jgi:hypothetical protein
MKKGNIVMKLRELLEAAKAQEEDKDGEYLETKVTNLGDKIGIRLIDKRDGKILDETSVKTKAEIQPAIKELLRMHDKMGGTSKMADASRHRNK